MHPKVAPCPLIALPPAVAGRPAPMKGGWLLALAALLAGRLCGDVILGAPFRDGAVLQRGKPIAVWGIAEPGERIQVEFHGESAGAVADKRGGGGRRCRRWSPPPLRHG